MDLYFAQIIAQIGSGTWIDDLSFLWSRWVFLGLVLSVIVLVSLLADKKHWKQYIVALLLGSLLFYMCNEIVCKHILTDLRGIRLRPYLAHPELFQAIGSQILDSSFPSSHTASTAMIMTLWIWKQRKFLPIAILITLVVAWSRIHNGMHYPSDVLAGAVFGVIYGISAIFLSKQILKKYFIH